MASSTAQHDINKIDEEIDLLQDRIIHLRLMRNSLVPIGCLLPELLERIFIVARSQGMATIQLSWVSHTWRTLALESKLLWTLINRSNVKWLGIHLERSSPVPLVVHFQESFRDKKLFMKAIALLPQLKALILPRANWPFPLDRVIQDAFSQHGPSPLPHLVSMKLAEVDVNKDMLSSLQNVRHLSFARSDVYWTIRPPQFPHLRSLSISLPNQEILLSTFFDILESMPRLETLILDRVFAPVYRQYQVNAKHAFPNGPNLASLYLTGELETNMMFLQMGGCITSRTNISLKVLFDGQASVDHIGGVLEAFDGFVTNAKGRTFGVTHLALHMSRQLSLFKEDNLIVEYGVAGVHHDLEQNYAGRANIQVDVTGGVGLTIISTLSQYLQLQALHSLWIDTNNRNLGITSWRGIIDTFGYLPQLQHLAISALYYSADALLREMSVGPSQKRGRDVDAPHQIPFSALKSLYFPSRYPEKPTGLYAFLQLRKSHGSKLETLGLAEEIEIESLCTDVEGNMEEFVDKIVVSGGKDDLMMQPHYQFLGRMSEDLDIPTDIV